MWIRSQDKTNLLKAEIVEYCYQLEQITKEINNKKGKPIYYLERPAREIVDEKEHHYIYVNEIKCAKYSSKEKALKVLDMIHKYINTGYVEKNKNNSEEYSILRTYGNVIIMPQDDEV